MTRALVIAVVLAGAPYLKARQPAVCPLDGLNKCFVEETWCESKTLVCVKEGPGFRCADYEYGFFGNDPVPDGGFIAKGVEQCSTSKVTIELEGRFLMSRDQRVPDCPANHKNEEGFVKFACQLPDGGISWWGGALR